MSNKNLFLKLFPVPDFLKINSVGVDISDGNIRYVEIVEKNGKKKLKSYGKVDLPEGVVVKGRIKDKVQFVKILNNIKKNFSSNFVRVSVIEKNSYIFRSRVPVKGKMSYDELRASLSFKLEENVPMKLEDTVFDFDVLNADKNFFDVVVAVLPKIIIDEFMGVFESAGLLPVAFEVESQAVARVANKEGYKGTFMVVDFRGSRVSLSVVSGGLVQLTSTVDIGGDEVIAVIQKYLNITKEEAEKINAEKGFVRTGNNDELYFAMTSVMSALKDEINKYLVYWHTNKDNYVGGKILKQVNKIILCGSYGANKGVDEYLSANIGMPVERANVWQNVFSLDEEIPKMDFKYSLEYAAAIGLAMGAFDKPFGLFKEVNNE